MIKVAIISQWHVHTEEYYGYFNESNHAQVTCAWSEDPDKGKNWADSKNIDFEENLDILLQRDDVDAVCINAMTTQHEMIMLKCAQAKKHIFTEKVAATTVAACNRINAAIQAHHIIFSVSMPWKYRQDILTIKHLLEQNKIGDVSLMRFRNAHNGLTAGWLPEYWMDEAQAGGGALMDLGCHGMYVSCYLFGKPKRITSLLTGIKSGFFMDEQASSTIEFEKNILVTCETSLIAGSGGFSLDIYGKKGQITIQEGKVLLCLNNAEPEVITLLEKGKRPVDQFIEGCLNKTTPAALSMEQATLLTQLVESSYLSNKENRTIFL